MHRHRVVAHLGANLLLEHLDVVFESLEGNKDDGQVVQGSSPSNRVEQLIHNLSGNGVNRGHLSRSVCGLTSLRCDFPNDAVDFIVLHFIKDAIRADESIVKLVGAANIMRDLRLTGHHALDASKIGQFGLTVAKSTADRETSREDSIGTHEGILFVVTVFRRWHALLPDLLSLSRR